ncbi:MAG TPA: porin [Candidatus Acidoferrales bacterium]|nr:porin [Candidatus Acidoferrales bacterium]
MKNFYIWTIIFAVLITSSSALGADSTSVAAQILSKVSWSGFVDVYYSKNFNGPSNQWNQLRNFDFYENQFALNLAKLTIQEQAQPVGFRVDLGIGTGNDIVQGLLNPLTGATTPSMSTLNLVEQAYLTAVIPVGSGLTVDIGKFATMMGYEVIESNGNWNYSRSLMFAWAIPYYHMGMRLTYPVTSSFTVALHIVNSWNTVVDNNKSKSVGLEFSYSPTPTTSITVNGMSGFEQPTGVPYGKRDVAELIATQQVGDNLSFALDVTYGRERYLGSLQIWKGTAVYAKYNLDSKSDIALRGEVYYDPNDYTTFVTFPKATFKEITATYEYRPWDPIILRLEARDDFANGNAFVSASTAAPTRASQPTLLVGVIATF